MIRKLWRCYQLWLWRRRLNAASRTLERFRRLDEAGVSRDAQYHLMLNPEFCKQLALGQRVLALHRLEELGDIRRMPEIQAKVEP
jgi:hypothetical protein